MYSAYFQVHNGDIFVASSREGFMRYEFFIKMNFPKEYDAVIVSLAGRGWRTIKAYNTNPTEEEKALEQKMQISLTKKIEKMYK